MIELRGSSAIAGNRIVSEDHVQQQVKCKRQRMEDIESLHPLPPEGHSQAQRAQEYVILWKLTFSGSVPEPEVQPKKSQALSDSILASHRD